MLIVHGSHPIGMVDSSLVSLGHHTLVLSPILTQGGTQNLGLLTLDHELSIIPSFASLHFLSYMFTSSLVLLPRPHLSPKCIGSLRLDGQKSSLYASTHSIASSTSTWVSRSYFPELELPSERSYPIHPWVSHMLTRPPIQLFLVVASTLAFQFASKPRSSANNLLTLGLHTHFAHLDY